MGLKQIICIFLFSVSWISSFDIDQLQVTVNSKNVLIKVPGKCKKNKKRNYESYSRLCFRFPLESPLQI